MTSSANKLAFAVPTTVIDEVRGDTRIVTGVAAGQVPHHTCGDGYAHDPVKGKPGRAVVETMPNGTTVTKYVGE
jgi:hypothetical protein